MLIAFGSFQAPGPKQHWDISTLVVPWRPATCCSWGTVRLKLRARLEASWSCWPAVCEVTRTVSQNADDTCTNGRVIDGRNHSKF